VITNVSGFTVKPIATGNSVEDMQFFSVQEASLSDLTRIILEIPIDPSEGIVSIAQQVQAACVEHGVVPWPEHQGIYTFIENNSLYIAYVKPAGQVSPSIAWIPILLIVGIIAPIIMYFAIPGFADMVNSIVMLVVMMLMMDLMKPMMESTRSKPKVSTTEARPPLEQRISRKIESIADSIARTERAFETSKEAGKSARSSVLSDIQGVARAIKGAPKTALSSYDKAKAAGQLDVLDDRLVKYREHLSPTQQEKLEEEQQMVDELRRMYD